MSARQRRATKRTTRKSGEIQRDLQSGHNIVSTVFIEHLAMYRADGPEEMKYVGEVRLARHEQAWCERAEIEGIGDESGPLARHAG